jgi:hypothetical protein
MYPEIVIELTKKLILKYSKAEPGSSDGIATGYELDCPGIESQCGRDIPHLSRPALGPPGLLYNGYRVFLGDRKRPGRDADSSPPSSAEF